MNRPRRNSVRPYAVALALLASAVATRGAEVAPPAPPEQAREDLNVLFGEITRNMDLIEQMLNRKDGGEACQGAQKSLVTQIDKLIEELKKRQSPCSNNSASDQSQGQGGKGSKDQEAEKRQRELEKMQGRTPKDQSAKKPGSGKPEPKGELQKDAKETQGKVPNDQVEPGKPLPAGAVGPLGEPCGRTGGWGFLPGEVRALIEASGRPGVPPKYEEIIRRYFQRLSEGDKTK